MDRLCIYSVSARAANRIVWQPRCGLLPLKSFTKTQLGPGEEEVHDCNFDRKGVSGLLATTVDYLTRYYSGTPVEKAFEVPLAGAKKLDNNPDFEIDALLIANGLLQKIGDLNEETIKSACKLVGFDVVYRAGADYFKAIESINPDKFAIRNIYLMVNRTLDFIKKYGPVTLSGPTFPGGYSDLVTHGDADFLTRDTIWDIKCTKNWILKKDTLQILMYYLMGKRSGIGQFQSIENLGIFNPRKNTVYQIAAKDIDPKVIAYVEDKIIGYGITEDEVWDNLKVTESDYHAYFD